MKNHDRPLAAPGLTSYRYKSDLGWIMIGAKTHAHALSEAQRSLLSGRAIIPWLEIWDESRGKYVPAAYN